MNPLHLQAQPTCNVPVCRNSSRWCPDHIAIWSHACLVLGMFCVSILHHRNSLNATLEKGCEAGSHKVHTVLRMTSLCCGRGVVSASTCLNAPICWCLKTCTQACDSILLSGWVLMVNDKKPIVRMVGATTPSIARNASNNIEWHGNEIEYHVNNCFTMMSIRDP